MFSKIETRPGVQVMEIPCESRFNLPFELLSAKDRPNVEICEGDTVITTDRTDEEQIEFTRMIFDKLKQRGLSPIEVDATNEPVAIMTGYDPKVEGIVFKLPSAGG